MNEAPSLFDMFGGIRATAKALDVSPSNVMGWKREGRIPAQQQPHVLAVGLSLGLPITAENVVFPIGRPTTDVADATPPVACDIGYKTQQKGASA